MKVLIDHKSSFTSRLKKYKIHLLVWIIFILYESIMVGLISGYFGKFGNYAVHYTINISLFYLNAHFVLPKALKNPETAFFRMPVFLGLEIIAYVLLVFSIDTLLMQYTDFLDIKDLKLEKTFWHRSVWRAIYFIGFSTGYYYLITYFKEKNRATELQKKNLKSVIEHQKTQNELVRAQNAFLKAQINPHFLFNTLSFIHSETQKIAPKVADSILSLSDMMRYALKNENIDDQAILTDEIEQVQNLIKLHQLRSDKQLHIQLKLKGDLNDINIIPLILLTLAENMFKHGDLSDPVSPALIEICLCDDNLLIRTKNLINPDKHATSFNLGLENIKRRLELKYRHQFSFTHHTDENNHYHTQILIEKVCTS